MKLLKLVYIGFGWVLALTDKSLFDEGIQAWEHGPVVPSLYHEFKHFKDNRINVSAGMFNLESRVYSEPRIPLDDKDTIMILGKVWHIYKQYNAWSLRNKTHEEGTPWQKTHESVGTNAVIKPSLINTHFKAKIKEYLDAV